MGIVVQATPDEESIGAYLGIGSAELAERDRFQQPSGRWLAFDGPTAVGLATAFVRVDRRLFVTHRLADESAFAPLLDAAVAGTGQAVHLSLRHDQPDRSQAAIAAGFRVDLEATAFAVPFADALAWTERHRASRRVRVVRADEVEPDALFALDTALRSDTPGSDGWAGNRLWFDDELASPEYDPAAYRVALDVDSGDLVGLCRFWNNPDGPTLGLVGVRSTHRTGRPALTLLHKALQAAAMWGFDTFSAHTARPALQRRLHALGAQPVGGFTRLVLER